MSMTGWSLFGWVFGMVFVAELPDKTALAALLLATRHKALPVFLGTAAALAIQSAVAVAAGQVVSLLPPRPVHVVSGLIFLVSAVFMWRRRGDQDPSAGPGGRDSGFAKALWTAFVVVFIAEWGDFTQLATAAFAARYAEPFTVFAGATLALWAVAALAVFLGNRAKHAIDPILTKRLAAVVFALVGVALITGVL